MLLAAGADPSKKVEYPENSMGNCIDYGYAEIEREKTRRKLGDNSKKEARNSKPERSQVRDHLKDHIRVVEYLQQASSGTNETRLLSSQPETRKKASDKIQGEKISTREETRNGKVETSLAAPKSSKHVKDNDVSGSKDKPTHLRTPQQGAGLAEPKESNSKRKAFNQVSVFDEEDSKQEFGKKEKGSNFLKTRRESKEKKLTETGLKGDRKNKRSEKIDSDLVHSKKRKKSKLARRKRRSKTERQHQDKKRRLERQIVGEFPSTKRLASSHSAAFPENLRRSLLRLFGNCLGVDASEFLLPYVVFRNGDLYYRFQGKATNQKEQYSLI